ncbi:hypothetical protein D3C71_1736730 [compost metagenome]
MRLRFNCSVSSFDLKKPSVDNRLVVSAFSCTARPLAEPPPVLRNRFFTSSGFSASALPNLVESTAKSPPNCCVMPTSAKRLKAPPPEVTDWMALRREFCNATAVESPCNNPAELVFESYFVASCSN